MSLCQLSSAVGDKMANSLIPFPLDLLSAKKESDTHIAFLFASGDER